MMKSYMDSRELQEEIDDLQDDLEIEDFSAEEKEEINERLNTLIQFKEEVYDSEWDYGITFIHSESREEYVEDFVRDVGDLSEEMWLHKHIDWESAADEFFQDHTSVELDGEVYYYRPS